MFFTQCNDIKQFGNNAAKSCIFKTLGSRFLVKIVVRTNTDSGKPYC